MRDSTVHRVSSLLKAIRRVMLLALLLPMGAWANVDADAFLWAVRQVETGDNPNMVGRLGERSAYQFRQSTWEMHTTASFSLAHTNLADAVAHAHVAWLTKRLADTGVTANATALAAAWNAGVRRATNPPACTRDYAERVSNLYHDRASSRRPVGSSMGLVVVAR